MGANIPVGGDLSGTSSDAVVVGLQTFPISPATPTAGYVLTWNNAGNTLDMEPGGSGGGGAGSCCAGGGLCVELPGSGRPVEP